MFSVSPIHSGLLQNCIIKPCIHFWFIFLFSASLTVTGGSWGKLFHTLSHTCQSQTARCGKTGLSEQHARLTVFTSVSIWGDEGGAYCMSGVCLLLHQVCVYFRMSPHSLILVSVAVAACTCAWFRLQLAHLIFSLNPPLPSPLFPLHTFPPFFFFFPPPASLVPAGNQGSGIWLSQHRRRWEERRVTSNKTTELKRGLPCAVSWRGVFLEWRELAGWRGHQGFGRRYCHCPWSCSLQTCWLETNAGRPTMLESLKTVYCNCNA